MQALIISLSLILFAPIAFAGLVVKTYSKAEFEQIGVKTR